MGDCVMRLLAEPPPGQRQVLLLHDLQGSHGRWPIGSSPNQTVGGHQLSASGQSEAGAPADSSVVAQRYRAPIHRYILRLAGSPATTAAPRSPRRPT